MNTEHYQMGKLFVISGPSGAGKTTICNTLCQTIPRLSWSISMTTRPKRDGEVEGKDYYFVAQCEFEARITQKEFLEYAKVHDHYYGTLRKPIEDGLTKGNHYLLEIDVQGGKTVKSVMPSAILIFVSPPSIESLRERLLSRNRDSLPVIEKRIKNAMYELENMSLYDHVVINDTLQQTITQIQNIMEKEIKKSLERKS